MWMLLMAMMTMSTGVWANETHPGYCAQLARKLPFLSDDQNVRLEQLRQRRMLLEGKHREYFLGESRTQWHFPTIEVNGRQVQPYATLKMLKLLSYKSADIVFGEKAALTCDDAIKRGRMEDLARRSKVHVRFHSAAVDASWAGGAFLLSCIWNGQSYVCNLQPEEIYPLGDLNPDDQYESYVGYRWDYVGAGDAKVKLLLETKYLRGSIERRVYQLAIDDSIAREISLTQWPGPEKDLPPVESTGIAENVITFVPNEIGSLGGQSDYDGLVGAQDAINSAVTQIARVLHQHSDPKLALPEDLFDSDGNVRITGSKAFPFRDKLPQYIVWDAELDAAMKNRLFHLTAFCIESEMSPVLLGIKEGAAPDAARKLRLEATNTLAKGKRESLNMEPAIGRALEVTLMLEGNRSGIGAIGPATSAPIGVEMHDGLPVDELDEATIVATYRTSGTMSIEAGVERRVRDPAAAAEEIGLIKKEAAAATPSVFMQQPGAGGEEPGQTEPNDTTNDTASTAQEAA